MNKILHSFQLISAPLFALSLAISSTAPAYAETSKSVQKQLEANIAGNWRSDANKARDKYRHPQETLTFFGVTPNAKVIELLPNGTAWYTEILAPFLKDKGQLTIINAVGNTEDKGQQEKFAADPAHYGKIKILDITPTTLTFGEPESADFFLTFRNVHNFAMHGDQDKLFAEIFKVLKPGGVLGIEDHRAAAGKTFEEVKMSGYLPEAFVIAEAEKAGFKLVDRSEINSNPKDTTNHPKGVWSLPPTLAEGETNRAAYLEIGESDRFTLRFIKPKK